MLMRDLMAEYPDANAVWMRDDGNGSGIAPQLVDYDQMFDNVQMVEIQPKMWISGWIIDGDGDNPHRYQIAFADGNPWESAAQKLGRMGGQSTSEAKKQSSRENGRKGGRPRRKQN